MRRLIEIARARSGDKGNAANIAVIARSQKAYRFLGKWLTEERVERFFYHFSPKNVIRYDVPNLGAFNFVLEEVLDGGGSVSLRVDAQGKSLGQALLQMPYPEEEYELS